MRIKILLYGINFSPELIGIGKYTGEMGAWLAAQGHEVRVVTAPPYYPDWVVRRGFSGRRYERRAQGGMEVWRCPLWVPMQPGGVKRLLHLASFSLTSLPIMLYQAFWRPDVVWVVEPALFSTPAAWMTARLCGAKAWLHVQDFEVDAAFDMGLLKGNALRKFVTVGERWLMQRFDVVSTISGRMYRRLLAKGVPAAKAAVTPNWVDISHIAHKASAASRPVEGNSYREALGIPPDSVVALYSGNMGGKQGLELLAEAAVLLAGHSHIVFVLCGNGAYRSDLVTRCIGLLNVHFMELQPAEQFSELLAMADVHMLPQRADAADLVMPSKLTGMLASGRPVLATAHPGTELAQVVGGAEGGLPCGVVVPPEQPQLFADALLQLAGDVDGRARMGQAARQYAETYLHIDAVLTRLVARMEAVLRPDLA